MPLRCLLASILTLAALVLPGRGETSTTVTARMVTLSEAGLPLSKALAEIEKQTGIRVEDRRKAGDPALKLTLRQVPFWKAIDAIADEVGASVYLLPREGRIALVKPLAKTKLPISYSGPIRLAIKRVTVSRDLENNAQHATASMEVAWEPHLQPFLLETRPQNLLVKDDQNKVLPFGPEGSSIAPVDGRMALLFDVALPAPKRSVNEYGVIEGSLSVVSPSKMLQFRFGSLGKLDQAGPGAAVRQLKQEGITCRITRIQLEKDHWTIQVTQDTPPGGGRLESFQSWVVNNEMTLESKDRSRRLTSSSYVLESATDRRAVLSYNFADKDGTARGKTEDWNLLYTTPASVVVTPIPFQFKNVPLP
jgi:hypothetical protein